MTLNFSSLLARKNRRQKLRESKFIEPKMTFNSSNPALLLIDRNWKGLPFPNFLTIENASWRHSAFFSQFPFYFNVICLYCKLMLLAILLSIELFAWNLEEVWVLCQNQTLICFCHNKRFALAKKFQFWAFQDLNNSKKTFNDAKCDKDSWFSARAWASKAVVVVVMQQDKFYESTVACQRKRLIYTARQFKRRRLAK